MMFHQTHLRASQTLYYLKNFAKPVIWAVEHKPEFSHFPHLEADCAESVSVSMGLNSDRIDGLPEKAVKIFFLWISQLKVLLHSGYFGVGVHIWFI